MLLGHVIRQIDQFRRERGLAWKLRNINLERCRPWRRGQLDRRAIDVDRVGRLIAKEFVEAELFCRVIDICLICKDSRKETSSNGTFKQTLLIARIRTTFVLMKFALF